MSPRRRINPDQIPHRNALRVAGVALTAVGGVFLTIGLASFFSAFNGGGSARYFWCGFVGMPMLGIGTMLLKLGYMGAVARYIAGETAPVAGDTINYLADETHGSMRKIAGAIGEGLRGTAAVATVACPACGHGNDADARFCDQCGAKMPTERTCASCSHLNDVDARFCANCGSALSQ